MNKLIWLGAIVGSTLGGYLPTLWGADVLSLTGVACSTLGGIAGVVLGWKLGRSI